MIGVEVAGGDEARLVGEGPRGPAPPDPLAALGAAQVRLSGRSRLVVLRHGPRVSRAPDRGSGRAAIPGRSSCRWGVVAPTSSPPDALAALARAWPDAVAGPDAAGAYADALEGLDPAVIGEVVDSLSGKGRAAPAPAILRTVVLSRQQTAATSLPIDLAGPATADAPPVADSRLRLLVPMLGAGLLLLGASGLTRDPWMTISSRERVVAIAGSDIGGGGVVAAAGPLAALIAVVGALCVWRARRAAHAGSAFGMLAAISVVAVFGAMTGLMRVSEAGNRFFVDVGPAAGGVTAELHHLVTVSTGPALWTTLALGLASTATAVYGLLALHRG